MNFGEILSEWYETKKKQEILEEKILKFKSMITKEMNIRNIDKISENNFIVSRRRISKSYVTKENIPKDLWDKYSIKCSYDAFFLTKSQEKKPEKNQTKKIKKNKKTDE